MSPPPNTGLEVGRALAPARHGRAAGASGAGPASVWLLCLGFLAAVPATSHAAFTISGRVFEDRAGDGLPVGQTAGDAANPGVNVGVTIQLYADNGDGLPGGGDALSRTTATVAGGTYTFVAVATGTYWVVVNSKQIAPSVGFNGSFAQTDVWAEQTWGPAGGLASDGAGGTTTHGSAGSSYGGRRGGQSDNTSALATAEHVAGVAGDFVPLSGEDFGFSFNVVTEVRAGDNADDDGAANRTVQGSLRQFLQNARAITGANAMRFVPDVATNTSGGGGAWWRINVTTALPVISDVGTAIDGTAYMLADGTTLRDANPGQLGSGGSVGVDALALSAVDRPELELRDIRSTTILPFGLDVQAANATIRRLAIYGFGDDRSSGGVEGNIVLDAASSGALVEWNVVGSGAGAFADPGAGSRTQADNILGAGATSNVTVRNNLIGYGAYMGVFQVGGPANSNWLVQANEVRGNAIGHSDHDGVAVEFGTGGTTIQGNLIGGHEGNGVDMITGVGGNTVVNNTITGNGIANGQSAGIRVIGAGSTIDRNVSFANYGPGVLVASGASANTITKNSIYANGTILTILGGAASGQIGIDLLTTGDAQGTGTAPFKTLNDAGDGDSGGNGLLNFPILSTATGANGNLVLSGFARPGSVIELFVAAADPSGFGEGQTYLLTLTEGGTGAGGNDPYADTDAGTGSYGPGAINGVTQGTDNTNRFTFTFPVPPGVVDGTPLTATARLGGATSEFSGGVSVVWRSVSGLVFEDRSYGGGAGRDSAAAAGVGRPGARVELYNNAGAFVGATTTDATGHYAFNALAIGNYTVRVVNDSVTSTRAGYVPSLRAVQTYRTDASGGTAVAVTDHVGGQNPAVADAGAAGAGAVMNTTTGVFTAGISGTAQSIVRVSIVGGNVIGVDFGFCFDVIVNRNDSGQGSLRQLLLNANALSNAGLAQVGRPAGLDNAIWMLADGIARPGLNAGYASMFSAGVASIALASTLPAVSSPAVIDGQTEPGWSNAPIVELNGVASGAGANGLSLTAGGTTVRGLIVNRFAGSGISITTAGGDTISGCWIGTAAGGTTGAANGAHGIAINGAASNVVGGTTVTDRNVISGNSQYGVSITGAAASGNIVRGNFIGLGATGTAPVANGLGVGVEGGATGTVIGGLTAGAGNVITGSGQHGVVIADAGTRGNEVLGNSIYNNTGLGITLNWDAVTPNNGTKNVALPNDDMDFPVFASAVLAGGSLTMAGYVGSAAGQATFGNARVEVFGSDNDASGFGEGRAYLGFLTADASGNFSGTLSAPGMIVGDRITATATDAGNSTSEFGPQRAVEPLTIVKRAYRIDGTPIPTGTVVPRGAVFKFLLYVSNPGPAVTDVSLRDVLDPGFTYLGGTIRLDNSQSACATGSCSGAEESAILAAVDAGGAGSDALDGDPVSRSGSTIYVGNQDVANAQLNIAMGRVFAVEFTVRIQ